MSPVIDDTFRNRVERLGKDRVILPDLGVLERLERKLATCSPEEFPRLYLEVAEALRLNAECFIDEDNWPTVRLGLVGGVVVVSDCAGTVNNTETILRIDGVSLNSWGAATDNLVPVSSAPRYHDTEPFNPEALSFSFASFLARNRLTREANRINSGPTLVILNAAPRDTSHPIGAPFVKGLFRGNVVAIGSGLETFSDAAANGYLIGDTIWKIDINAGLQRHSLGIDLLTHFRSQFLERIGADWFQGKQIVDEQIDASDIPLPRKAEVIEGGQIVTSVATLDCFGNVKLRLHRADVDALRNPSSLSIEINGVALPLRLANAISKGEDGGIIMVEGSSWHTVGHPNGFSDDSISRSFMDIFIRGGNAREAFANGGRLPRPGDTVIIR